MLKLFDSNIYSLVSNEAYGAIFRKITIIKIQESVPILSPGEHQQYLYFIKKGVVRSYYKALENEICAPYVCFTVTLITEPYDPTGGTGGTEGAQIPNGSNGTGGYGNSGGNTGGNYLNQCNPNIPSGTNVPSNQLPPCSIYTPITVINPGGMNYNTFEGFENDPYYQPFFEELNDAEKQFLKSHLNLIASGTMNYLKAKDYGNERFYNAQADNTNANAYKHMIWCGTNYLSWDLGNNTNYAKTLVIYMNLAQAQPINTKWIKSTMLSESISQVTYHWTGGIGTRCHKRL